MSTLRKVQNRLHELKVEIMELEETIKRAEKNNKPHFAKRLRMIIKKKLERIDSLASDD